VEVIPPFKGTVSPAVQSISIMRPKQYQRWQTNNVMPDHTSNIN